MIINQILWFAWLIIGTLALIGLSFFNLEWKRPEVFIWIVLVWTIIGTISIQLRRHYFKKPPATDERTLKIMAKSMQISWMISYFILLFMILLDIEWIMEINYKTICIVALLMSSSVQITRLYFNNKKIK